MLGKMLLLLLIYAGISLADIPRLKKVDRREIIAYTFMALLSFYLGINYIFELKWPFLEEAAAVLLGEPARRIVEFLKVPS
ncbi:MULTISPECIES: hypothetical protein [unclassified Paenibacillus]|uniref:hypothetical protein n=1 Tax=unclassified Paenibacillus TaxID=185978 RepID=UPI0027834C6B|nr:MULTISPECIES: hypothetical protein [unclassified Paenibacillus]MDQ0901003.1 hypothetical protein [Paenibacillus sp. V4I7]MDQ0920496.1 hypothetical protein [Paenibacillus sp. V4I5]